MNAGLIALLALLCLLGIPTQAHAYIGPGAGFAGISSFLVVFTTFLIAMASVLLWPFLWLSRLARPTATLRPLVKRLIIVGPDRQDPKLNDRFRRQGILPNFSKPPEG